MTSAVIATLLAKDATAASLRTTTTTKQRSLNQVVPSDHLVSHTEKVMYTCTFSSTWNSENHPVDYPEDAHASPPVLVAHNANYKMFTPGAAASAGVKKVAETGNPDELMTELLAAGADVMSYIQGVPMFFGPMPMEEMMGDMPMDGNNATMTTRDGGRRNLVEKVSKGLDPIYDTRTQTLESMLVFTPEHTMFTGIAMLAPSPDWFSSTHGNQPLADNADGEQVWLKSFKYESMPYDAGTDSGETFHSEDLVTDPVGVVTAFEVGSTDTGIFENAAGDTILPVYGWECSISEVKYLCEFDENCTDGTGDASSPESGASSTTLASGLAASLLAGAYLFL